MKFKEIMQIIQDPVIIINNNNLGRVSSFNKPEREMILNYNVDWIEAVQTIVAVHLSNPNKPKRVRY